MKSHIKIGTRGSQLALYQAELLKATILGLCPLIDVSLAVIKTSGDMVRRRGPHPFDTKRLFTREIEDALLKGEVDLAVHSAKDLAADLPQGLEIGGVLEREDPRDCLVSKDHQKLSELPMGARIGTSSLRRKKQLERFYPEIHIEEIRGNVDTRIRKIEEGFYDAIVLAHAGIKRLGLGHYVTEIFDQHRFYPAAGQGIIAIECRTGDSEILEILHPINHPDSFKKLKCERAFLRRLEGGCQLPCGITTEIDGDQLKSKGALFSLEGNEWVEGDHGGPVSHPEKIGIEFAEKILQNGGEQILNDIRRSGEKHAQES